MRTGRTDLALERHERLTDAPEGVVVERRSDENARMTRIREFDSLNERK